MRKISVIKKEIRIKKYDWWLYEYRDQIEHKFEVFVKHEFNIFSFYWKLRNISSNSREAKTGNFNELEI